MMLTGALTDYQPISAERKTQRTLLIERPLSCDVIRYSQRSEIGPIFGATFPAFCDILADRVLLPSLARARSGRSVTVVIRFAAYQWIVVRRKRGHVIRIIIPDVLAQRGTPGAHEVKLPKI